MVSVDSILREKINSEFSEKRARHIFGVEEAAVYLAEKYGESVSDARTAALLHDITKEKKSSEQLKMCEECGIIIGKAERMEPSIIHALTGAYVAENVYGAKPEIVSAVRRHTTGDENMTKLDEIIYLADVIEKNRDFDGVEELRAACEISLDYAMLESLDYSIKYLIKKKAYIHPDTIKARNFFITKGIFQ